MVNKADKKSKIPIERYKLNPKARLINRAPAYKSAFNFKKYFNITLN